jgi:hypothetical protein
VDSFRDALSQAIVSPTLTFLFLLASFLGGIIQEWKEFEYQKREKQLWFLPSLSVLAFSGCWMFFTYQSVREEPFAPAFFLIGSLSISIVLFLIGSSIVLFYRYLFNIPVPTPPPPPPPVPEPPPPQKSFDEKIEEILDKHKK